MYAPRPGGVIRGQRLGGCHGGRRDDQSQSRRRRRGREPSRRRRSHAHAHRHRHLVRRDARRRGHPRRRRADRVGRRRHRVVRLHRLPARCRRPRRQHPGAQHARSALADLPVPDPGVADPGAEERLRSDSASTPGCIWGFPSYGVREAWREKTLAPLWSVLTEPILTDYWTPKAGRVFEDLKREADRISFWDCQVKGQVRMVRRRAGGGYFTILTPPAGASATKRVAYRSTYVHLAVGYPGVKFLPDLQDFRQKYPESGHVVNAYEPHEHVYQQLQRRPGTVMVRGSGIVGSRILQRLIDDRDRTARRPRSSTSSAPTSTTPRVRRSSCGARARTAGPTRASTGPSRRGAARPATRSGSSKARTASGTTRSSAERTRPTANSGSSSSRGGGARASTAPTSDRSAT